MLDAARYWLEFGVDGFRVDYAIGPAADFWAEFRMITRQTKPDCWTFGEIVDPSDVQMTFAGQLDGALDFILLEGLRQAIAFGRWNGFQLASFLERHQIYFPEDFSRPSFLDNHDMNRFLWAAAGDQRRLETGGSAPVQFVRSAGHLLRHRSGFIPAAGCAAGRARRPGRITPAYAVGRRTKCPIVGFLPPIDWF